MTPPVASVEIVQPVPVPVKITEPDAFLPKWAQVIGWVGVPAAITFFLLGAIPGVASPIDRIVEAVKLHNQTMIDHDAKDVARITGLQHTLAAICYRLPENPRAPRCDP